MATQKQIEANRANAKRSTGPRTRSGKRRASQNARQHGLTAAVDPDLVDAFFQCIWLHVPRGLPPQTWMRLRGITYNLAQIEARLHAINIAVDAFWAEDDRPLYGLDVLEADREMVDETLLSYGADKKGIRLMERLEQKILKSKRKMRRSRLIEFRKLKRYRAEAEAQRSSWLKRFTDEIERAQPQNPETKPIST